MSYGLEAGIRVMHRPLFWAVDYAILFTCSMNLSERHLRAGRSSIAGLSNLESIINTNFECWRRYRRPAPVYAVGIM